MIFVLTAQYYKHNEDERATADSLIGKRTARDRYDSKTTQSHL